MDCIQWTTLAELVSNLGLSVNRPVIHTSSRRDIALNYRRIQQSLQTKSVSMGLQTSGYLYLLLAAYLEGVSPSYQQKTESSSTQANIVQQAIHYLTTQYAEPITIEGMSESLGYNRAYLSRLFKQYSQFTPATFLLRFRVDKARQLLRERSELSIEHIASSVGFQDPLYFTKQFRRFYHLTPSEYRSLHLS